MQGKVFCQLIGLSKKGLSKLQMMKRRWSKNSWVDLFSPLHLTNNPWWIWNFVLKPYQFVLMKSIVT